MAEELQQKVKGYELQFQEREKLGACKRICPDLPDRDGTV